MGTLYLVATPIGNLEDITLRALRVLREVPLIAAEDTRHTRKLLSHYQIATPITSYHAHSAVARRDALVAALAAGDVALVTDAGTPAVSDPGAALVRAALVAGHRVEPVPGPAAAVAALIASGLPTDSFLFLGFLPRRATARRDALAAVRDAPWTLVIYEAPHRVLACLDDLRVVLGDRPAALARELTKAHEEFVRGTLGDIHGWVAAGGGARGELTIVIAGAPAEPAQGEPGEPPEPTAEALLRALLGQGLGTRAAAARVAATGIMERRDAYRLSLRLAAESAAAESAAAESAAAESAAASE